MMRNFRFSNKQLVLENFETFYSKLDNIDKIINFCDTVYKISNEKSGCLKERLTNLCFKIEYKDDLKLLELNNLKYRKQDFIEYKEFKKLESKKINVGKHFTREFDKQNIKQKVVFTVSK